VNSFANSRVGAASTNVAAHCLVDIGVGGLGNAFQESNGTHYLARLTIATLRDIQFPPCNLDRVVTVFGQTLDRCNFSAFGCRCWKHAGAHWLSIDVDGTGAAKRFSATVLGAGQACDITDCPQEWHGWVYIEAHTLAVKFEIDSHSDNLLLVAGLWIIAQSDVPMGRDFSGFPLNLSRANDLCTVMQTLDGMFMIVV
jgi:hypothetical protein